VSLYADYLKEREDFSIIESELGFASYKCVGDECYLRDLYVIPSHRQTKVASDMADRVCDIAKLHGCTYLLGTVSPQDKNATRNMQVLIQYGMKLVRSSNDLICFIKELQ
jgi:hypothetical protein